MNEFDVNIHCRRVDECQKRVALASTYTDNSNFRGDYNAARARAALVLQRHLAEIHATYIVEAWPTYEELLALHEEIDHGSG